MVLHAHKLSLLVFCLSLSASLPTIINLSPTMHNLPVFVRRSAHNSVNNNQLFLFVGLSGIIRFGVCVCGCSFLLFRRTFKLGIELGQKSIQKRFEASSYIHVVSFNQHNYDSFASNSERKRYVSAKWPHHERIGGKW